MYNLGEHFKVKNENVSSNLIFKGDKYRISILSNSLVRIEYNEFGAQYILEKNKKESFI